MDYLNSQKHLADSLYELAVNADWTRLLNCLKEYRYRNATNPEITSVVAFSAPPIIIRDYFYIAIRRNEEKHFESLFSSIITRQNYEIIVTIIEEIETTIYSDYRKILSDLFRNNKVFNDSFKEKVPPSYTRKIIKKLVFYGDLNNFKVFLKMLYDKYEHDEEKGVSKEFLSKLLTIAIREGHYDIMKYILDLDGIVRNIDCNKVLIEAGNPKNKRCIEYFYSSQYYHVSTDTFKKVLSKTILDENEEVASSLIRMLKEELIDTNHYLEAISIGNLKLFNLIISYSYLTCINYDECLEKAMEIKDDKKREEITNRINYLIKKYSK